MLNFSVCCKLNENLSVHIKMSTIYDYNWEFHLRLGYFISDVLYVYNHLLYVRCGMKIKSSTIQYSLLIMCYEPIVTISYNDGKYNYIF